MSGASPFVGRPPSKRPIASASNKSAVERLTNYQLDEFREAFENIDLDGNGEISRDELAQSMRLCGMDPTEADVERLFSAADSDGSGTIDFYEFVCLVAHELRTEEPEIEAQRYRNAFDIFDEDKSGFVDAKEMRRMMINLGESVTLEEVDDALTAFDIDGNGQIDYEEFSKVLADHSRLGKFALPRDEGETMKHTSARRAGSVLPFTMNQSPAPALGTGGLATEVGEEPARKGFFAWLFGRRS